MIFTVRKLQETCIEQNKPLNLVFIDLTKAFDTVNREALWTLLERIGCPPNLVSMIRLFHDGMTGQVLSNGNVTDAFVLSNVVKQGCILAPVLFNVFFTCMLSHAVQDLEKGGLHSLPLERLPLRPVSTHCKEEKPANSPSRGSLCRRLRTSGPHRTRPTSDAGPLLRRIQALWPDNQSRKDGGAPPTYTILPPSPYHHHWR